MTLKKLEAHLVDESQHQQILDFTVKNIDFHHVFSALKYHEQGRLESVKLSLFEVNDGQRLLYCILHELFEESVKVLINTDSYDADFLRNATFAVIDQAFPILSKYDCFYSAYIRQDIRKIMMSHPLLIKTYPFRPMDEPNECYYSTDDQCKKLEERNIELPDDYYFVSLRECDSKQICDEQIYTSKADEKFVELRIRNFPSVGAAYKPLGEDAEKPGNLACYEYTDGLGVISLLYCQKNHRGKRLATLVEEKICQLNLKESGIRPYKGVSINRPRVIQMTQKSYLWTNYKDAVQNNELYYCSLWCQTDRPRVVIYED